jgi:hypothetical protein
MHYSAVSKSSTRFEKEMAENRRLSTLVNGLMSKGGCLLLLMGLCLKSRPDTLFRTLFCINDKNGHRELPETVPERLKGPLSSLDA